MSYCVNTISSKTEQFSALISGGWGREAVKYGPSMVDFFFFMVDCNWSGFVCALAGVCVSSKCIEVADEVDSAGAMRSEQGVG